MLLGSLDDLLVVAMQKLKMGNLLPESSGALRALRILSASFSLFSFCLAFVCSKIFGRHLVGVWIGGVWNGHFPESEKYFSEAEFPGESLKFRRQSDFYQISGSEI